MAQDRKEERNPAFERPRPQPTPMKISVTVLVGEIASGTAISQEVNIKGLTVADLQAAVRKLAIELERTAERNRKAEPDKKGE